MQCNKINKGTYTVRKGVCGELSFYESSNCKDGNTDTVTYGLISFSANIQHVILPLHEHLLL